MAEKATRWGLGQHIAPPRFIIFCVVFVIGLFVAIPPLGLGRGTLVAFDIASALFLASLTPLLGRGQAAQMREQAKRNDANRAGLLALTGVVMLVVLVAVAGELSGKPSKVEVILVVGTLALAWLFSNTIYALHYAHLFYTGDDQGKDSGGLDFPHCDQPDYWDFVYFSFTLGMTFQTSDIDMTSRKMRRVTIGQCLAAFVFNIGVLAFTINVLGGG
jgi:uncharacterized membrane protein